jgi:integrase/recombinase XerD
MRYKHKRQALTDEEADKLVSACKTNQEKLVIWTILATGLRVEEFCSLTLQNTNLANRRFRIAGKNTKGGEKKIRIVPMTSTIQVLLNHHFALNNEIGITTRTANRIVHRVSERAGIMRKDVGPHVLRHTFAVRSLREGVSVADLSKILGHEDMETTLIYLNPTEEDACRSFLRVKEGER